MSGTKTGSGRQARSVARLAAVQALYQMETAGAGVETVIREFCDHRFDRDLEGETLAHADEAFFGALVRGVVADQADVDKAVGRRLATGWRLDRIDATARSILRAGAYELMRRSDVPAEVAIDEYVEIAKSFFEGPEPGFINAALDAIARDERAA
jgi:N utilization substance protein B